MAQMDLSSWKVVYFLTLISAGDHLISRKLSHGNLSFINQTLTPNFQNLYLTGKSKLVTAPTDDCMTDSWLQYCCTDCGAILSARACTRQVPAEARAKQAGRRLQGRLACQQSANGAAKRSFSRLRRFFPWQQVVLADKGRYISPDISGNLK